MAEDKACTITPSRTHPERKLEAPSCRAEEGDPDGSVEIGKAAEILAGAAIRLATRNLAQQREEAAADAHGK